MARLPPTDGETPPTDGETPPTDGETPPTDGEITPPPPIEQANPFDPIMPANEALLGKSRLGGLSINKISGRKFLADLVMTATGQPIEDFSSFIWKDSRGLGRDDSSIGAKRSPAHEKADSADFKK